jgi:riboflavin synthase
MFTGIIEDLGEVKAVSGSTLEVRTALDGIKKGDSVAVNGVCLTVTALSGKNGFSTLVFDYTPETSGKTTLDSIKAGARVNLERAMMADSRFGGHFVTGHVEATAKISSIEKAGNSVVFSFELPSELMKYVAAKGSVTLEGISLTVADRSKKGFSVSVIPFTYANTNLKFKKSGDTVNIETDIIGKYVENLSTFSKGSRLSAEFLKENGF